MLETVPELVSLTAALLLSLSLWFSDGMTAYKDEDYAAATAAYTKVVDATAHPNPFYETALYWRAQSRVRMGSTNDAIADIESLLEHSPAGPLTVLAAEAYKELSGKEWHGILLGSPEEAWESMLRSVAAGDEEGLRLCCDGKLMVELGRALAKPNAWQEMSRELEAMELREVVYNTSSNKACITIGKVDSVRSERLLLIRTDARWKLVDEFDVRRHADFMADDDGDAETQRCFAEDGEKLRKLETAMRRHVMMTQSPPRELADLKELVEDYGKVSVSSSDNKPFVVSYPASGEVPWLFTSTPTNAQRQVYMNGQVRIMPERTFRDLARQFGVAVPHDWSDLRITDAERLLIGKLIAQLGDSSFAKRREAYRKLKSIGSCAGAQLDEARQDTDPEIAAQAKRLLSEL
jgi:hypothetical protein